MAAGVVRLSSAQAPVADGGPDPPAAAATDAAAAGEASGGVAPVLLEGGAARYPFGSGPAPGAPAPSVALRLTIEADGRVSDAAIVLSAGPELDAAARAAALQYRFAPATRDGLALASRLTVHVPFALPVEPVLPSPPSPPAAMEPEPATAPRPLSSTAEVTIRGRQREPDRLAQSADAVVVRDLTRARRESAAMAEVLARIPGVSLRRSGGLGSDERISLNGLSDEYVATFVDTIPADFSLSAAGIGSFPVSLSDRIEVYKGVVPVRFGTDALGGAINIVTDQQYENRLGASAELGSFGTQRLTLGGTYRHEPSGLVANVQGFYDHADNDYEVDVEVPDARGRSSPARVPRFHDAYRAYGALAEVGVLDRPWARRLFVQGYLAGSDKELQHNTIMTVPYGEVESAERTRGVTARYELDVRPELKLQAVAAYAYREAEFVDRSPWVYTWRGERARRRAVPGEIDGTPTDQLTWRHNLLLRASLAYAITPAHTLTLTTSPTYVSQTGETRTELGSERDPLAVLDQRLTTVTGLEHEANLLPISSAAPAAGTPTESDDEADYRLQNRVFFKHYLYQLWHEQDSIGGGSSERTTDSSWFGLGDGVRVRLTRWLMLKLSYEYAVRLPSAAEVFGDGAQVRPNIELEPEVSHNANVGPIVNLTNTGIGDWSFELTGFVRGTDNQIVLIGTDRSFKHENVYSARSLGIDGTLGWTSPGGHVILDGTATVQDFRNTSQQGQFESFEGDRLPNKPWLFGSWGARLHFEPGRQHRVEPFYSGRFVGGFFRGWESAGDAQYKQRIAAQLAHGLGVSYVFESQDLDYSATLEAQNLTDARLYDYFGVQRAGRSISLKVAGELH